MNWRATISGTSGTSRNIFQKLRPLCARHFLISSLRHLTNMRYPNGLGPADYLYLEIALGTVAISTRATDQYGKATDRLPAPR